MRLLNDTLPPPPDYGNPLQILGWIAVVTVLSIVLPLGVRLTKVGARGGGEPVEAKETVTMPDGTSQSVSSEDPGLIRAVAALAATQSAMQEENRALRADVDELRQKSQEQDTKLSVVTSIVTRLRAKVAPIVGWIDAGAEPPVPVIDPELRELLKPHD